MELSPVTCNHCGAALQVPDSARFVTCRYCSSQLEIKRTASTITTQVLQRIDATTTSMAQDLQALRRESEIERLDREWTQKQGSLLTRDKHGNTSRPTANAGIIIAVVMGGFGLLWTIGAFTMSLGAHAFGAPGPFQAFACFFPLFGILFIATAIGMGIKTVRNAGQYDREERQYLARRQQLLAQQNSPTPEDQPANDSMIQ